MRGYRGRSGSSAREAPQGPAVRLWAHCPVRSGAAFEQHRRGRVLWVEGGQAREREHREPASEAPQDSHDVGVRVVAHARRLLGWLWVRFPHILDLRPYRGNYAGARNARQRARDATKKQRTCHSFNRLSHLFAHGHHPSPSPFLSRFAPLAGLPSDLSRARRARARVFRARAHRHAPEAMLKAAGVPWPRRLSQEAEWTEGEGEGGQGGNEKNVRTEGRQNEREASGVTESVRSADRFPGSWLSARTRSPSPIVPPDWLFPTVQEEYSPRTVPRPSRALRPLSAPPSSQPHLPLSPARPHNPSGAEWLRHVPSSASLAQTLLCSWRRCRVHLAALARPYQGALVQLAFVAPLTPPRGRPMRRHASHGAPASRPILIAALLVALVVALAFWGNVGRLAGTRVA